MRNNLPIEGNNSLTDGLNNLKVTDLTLLHSSRMSLIVVGMNLLIEGLSEPSAKYNCPKDGYARSIYQGDRSV